MNILFISPDHSMKSSGVTTVVSQLADQLVEFDKSITITIASTGINAVHQNPKVNMEIIPADSVGKFFHWPYRLVKVIIEIIEKRKINIIHIHGIWREINLAGIEAGRQLKLPVLISPHGMLEPWLWEHQGLINKLKKEMYYNIFLKSSTPDTFCMHSITKMEEKSIKKYFDSSCRLVVPNAIKFNNENFDHTQGFDTENPYILYLGRLHPKKGIDILIESFFEANLPEKWKLKIAGPLHNTSYIKKLTKLVEKRNLTTRVTFIGSVYEKEKHLLLQHAWVLAVPSYSEVVGMVNLEAALCKTPSITTFETGLWDWESGGGILIKPNTEDLILALQKVTSWSCAERQKKGEQSFNHAKSKYSWNTVLPMWKDFYSKIGERHGFTTSR